MDVYFTTVIRGGSLEQGGELVRVDWQSKRVLNKVPLKPFDPAVNDPNPRGNSRGGRGIVLHDDMLWVATYHSLHVYDRNLNFRKKLSHPLFVGLHELAADGDTIWATSTSIDAVIGVDFHGNLKESWWPREDELLQRHLGVVPLNIDKARDNRLLYLDGDHLINRAHLHLNAVAKHNGKLFTLFNHYGIVYSLSDRKIILEDPSIQGCHNLLFNGGYIFVNDTRGRRIVIYDLDGKLVKAIELLSFPDIAEIYRRCGRSMGRLLSRIERNHLLRKAFKASKNLMSRFFPVGRGASIAAPIFVRGLFPLGDSRLLVSFSPATIIALDFERAKLLDLFQYSENVEICPHGLLAVE